jgi:hypothetical protein
MATTNAISNKTGTLTVDNALTVTAGGATVSAGNIAATNGTVTGGTGLTATTGNVTVTAGNLELPSSTSTVGQIQFNGVRYMHEFGDFNVFVGRDSGNFTMTGDFNTGCGLDTLKALTSGRANDAFGSASLRSCTTGSYNTGFGYETFLKLTTGSYDIGIGHQTFPYLTTGSYNVGIGANGTAIARTGFNYRGAESSNILIQNVGVTGESNKMRIGTDGTGNCQVDTAVIAGTNVTISGAAAAGTVNIATGAGAKVVTLGSTNGASSLALKYGTADFTIASATGTTMSILDTGEMTMPLQSAFLAYLGSNDDNATGDGTAYILGTTTALTEVFDQNADFNTNGTFTAPVTGRYMLGMHIDCQQLAAAMSLAGGIECSNRTFYIRNATALVGEFTYTLTVLADMDAGDTAQAFVTISGATKVVNIVGDGNVSTGFYGHLAC